jgi:glycine dehydrogenase subunit 1
MRYLGNTPSDIAEMLARIGVSSVDDLFEQVPAELRLDRPLALPEAMSEPALLDHLERLARSNRTAPDVLSFAGAGVYRHASPVAVDYLLKRGELFTAYTPYQPEISQGTLQAVFEFQTMVAELLGTDVANASMYDGSTATAEAILMARRLTRRDRVLVSGALHPEYSDVCRTYNEGNGGRLETVSYGEDGATDLDALERALGKDVAAVVIELPNFFGVLEDIARVADLAHASGALLVVAVTEATALGVIEAPGTLGADIVAGEGQALGLPMNLGGPHCGLFGARMDHVRQMPGRLAGQTQDTAGLRSYVLTLATREQHIRRERATSNICTNQGLMALAVCIYLSLMGPEGLARVGRANLALGRRLRLGVERSKRLAPRFPGGPIYNELAVRVPGDAAEVARSAQAQGVLPGVPLGRFDAALADTLLVNVTELHTEADVDRLLAVLDAA